MKTQDELSLKSKPIYLFCDVLPKNAQSYIFFRPILSQKKKKKKNRTLSLSQQFWQSFGYDYYMLHH